mgnify:CR=1 FL=1
MASYTINKADILRAVSSSTEEQALSFDPSKRVVRFPAWVDFEIFSKVQSFLKSFSFPAAITYACADTSSLDMPEWSIGMISLPIIIIFIPLTIFASQIGANIAHLLNELFLRRIFSIFILLMSIRMIYQVIV